MTDEDTKDKAGEAHIEGAPGEGGAPTDANAGEAPLTNEERLRALTSDRKPKSRGKGTPAPGDAQHHPGDVVDAVRERSNMDSGRDTPF
jgi:hypothetical protein